MNIVMSADNTTVVLNGNIIDDFQEGDTIVLSPVNPVTSHTNGAKGNVIIKKRTDGDVYDLTLNILKFSKSDIYLNNAINADTPVLFAGSVKETYVKDGTEGVENWILENGSLTDRPTDTKNNQDGNSTLEYKLRFRRATRLI